MLKIHLSTNTHIGRKLMILFAIVIAIGGGVYVFMSSDTVPTTTAGSGRSAVSGYAVTNLHYTLNAISPTNIDSLTFTISPAVLSTSSSKVTVSTALNTGGPNTYTCTTDTAGLMVTCATTGPQLTADKLTGVTVAAAE
jgi:hypothetical protein